MLPSRQDIVNDPSCAFSILDEDLSAPISGLTTKFPARSVMSVVPPNESITTVPDCNSAKNLGSPENATWLPGVNLIEPFPLSVKVVLPFSPVRTTSPGKIVLSAGAGIEPTKTSPTELSEPSACPLETPAKATSKKSIDSSRRDKTPVQLARLTVSEGWVTRVPLKEEWRTGRYPWNAPSVMAHPELLALRSAVVHIRIPGNAHLLVAQPGTL